MHGNVWIMAVAHEQSKVDPRLGWELYQPNGAMN
jgi:hypothetical protein